MPHYVDKRIRRFLSDSRSLLLESICRIRRQTPYHIEVVLTMKKQAFTVIQSTGDRPGRLLYFPSLSGLIAMPSRVP